MVVAAVRCVIVAQRLQPAVRTVAALVFAPVALFCMYGFAASMEPGDYHIVWRVAYAIIFLACLSAIGRLVLARQPKKKPNQD